MVSDLRDEVCDVSDGLILAASHLTALASVHRVAGTGMLLKNVTNLNLRHFYLYLVIEIIKYQS